MSRSDLVHRLDYRDPASGHEALTAALLNGSVSPHLSNRFAGAFEVDDALVGSVISATMRQKRDEARLDCILWKLTDAISGKKRRLRVASERAHCASFRPHLQVQTQREGRHRFSSRPC
jgi:hypothetical protein